VRKGKTRSSPALENERCIFQRIKDTLHGIIDRENKAGCQLTDIFPGVYQGGSIRKKEEMRHDVKEFFLPFIRLLSIISFY
jgi:hypothetical protein